jgi:hypothetical protein
MVRLSTPVAACGAISGWIGRPRQVRKVMDQWA